MLYKLAHILRDRFGFIWNLVEWGNALVFALIHKSTLNKIPAILKECSGQYTLRMAECADAAPLAEFFSEQPEESFEFFKPHAFNEKTLAKIIRNKAFLTFLVLDVFEPDIFYLLSITKFHHLTQLYISNSGILSLYSFLIHC